MFFIEYNAILIVEIWYLTYEKTLFLSSLLFLLTGRDFSEHDAQTKKEIKKARKEAVHDYVNQKIQEANQRQKELAVQIDNLDDTIDTVLFYSCNDGGRKCVSVTTDYGNF